MSGRLSIRTLLLSGLGLCWPLSAAFSFAAADVKQGIELYWAGQYLETVALLTPLCSAESREDVAIECYKYLAFSHVALGDTELAQQTFSRLLAQDAEYQLDTSLVSPKILEQFHVSRGQLIGELFEKGKAAYFEKDYGTATELLAQVLRLDPEHLAKEYSQLASEQLALLEKQASLTKQAPAPPPPVEVPEDRIYHVTSRMTPPVLVSQVQPDYPSAERRAGREGTVILTAVIGMDGVVRDAKVIRSVSPGLDASAIHAVERWRYRPARIEDQEVAVYTVVRLAFTLKR